MSIAVAAQTAPAVFVKGHVINEQGVPLPGAVVSLLRTGDSTLYKAGLVNNSGDFLLDGVAIGKYLVRISHIGYKVFISDAITVPESGVTLAATTLSIGGGAMKEVIVTGNKPTIEQRIDATVINITDQVRKEAPNAFEILRFASNINLSDNEDNIEMTGKSNVQVMINGKVVRLSGRDLVKLLKSINTGSVSQVDVMSNPSAKYEVQGNGGIINIRLKRPDLQGTNGSIDFGDTKGVNHLGDLSTSLNFGLKNFSLNTYLAYHYGKYQTKYTEERIVNPNGNAYAQDKSNTHVDKWSDPVLRIGADWYLSSKHTLGAQIELEKSTNTSSYQTYTNIGKLHAPYDSSFYTTGYSPNTRKWNTYNLNYRYTDTLNNVFNFDIDRSYYNKVDDNKITNLILKAGSPDRELPLNSFQTNTTTGILTFKGDYEKSYKSKLKIEAGFKISHVKTDNDQLARFMKIGAFQTDTSNSNSFRYDEYINAVYGSIGKRFRTWGFQAGLRIEHTKSLGVATSLKNVETNKPDTSYTNVMPSLFLTYAPNKNHNFRLSLVHRIKRPKYEDLQPFDYQIDQFYYHIGNPGLRAQKNYNAELNYSFKNKLSVAASYVYTTDYFTGVLYQQQGIVYEMIGNSGKSKVFNLSISYPIRFKSWWSSENRVNLFNNHFTGELLEGYLDQGKWSYNLYSSQRFVLPGQYIFRLTGRYNAPQQRLYFFDEESGSVSASIGKQVFNKKGTIRLGVSDIFFTQRILTNVSFGNLKYTQKNTWESRTVFIEFTWRFGSDKIKATRERQTGNTDEKSRTK
jgi:hypothetical protein